MTAAGGTITDVHAAGIKPDKGKVGGVIDLIAGDGTTPAVNEQIVMLPIKLIEDHPRNPPGRTDDVDDLVAGIKELGVQSPVVVCTGKAYNAGRLDGDREVMESHYVIVGGGHRRKAAAVKAGLTDLPCIVRDHLADAKGRKAALLENLHRKQLGVFEEAEAFAELRERYGVTQTNLASTVGCHQSHISKRLKLLKLPSVIRSEVLIGKMSIPDAVELASVADDPQLLDDVLGLCHRQTYLTPARAIATVKLGREMEAKRAAVRVELEAAGETVTDLPSSYTPYNGYACTLTGLSITLAKHKKEPCHAMSIDQDGTARAVCTSPKRHAKSGKSTVKTAGASARSDSVADSQAESRRVKKLLAEEVEPARWAWLRDNAMGKSAFDPKDLEELSTRGTVILACAAGAGCGDASFILAMFGITAPSHVLSRGLVEEIARTNDGAKVRLAASLSYFEQRLCGHMMRWWDDDRWYLEVLERNGYQVTDLERQMLGDKHNTDGTWSTVTENDVHPRPPSCNVCFKSEGDPVVTQPRLDATLMETLETVTILDSGLCTACQHARDAGWIFDVAV